MLGALLIFVTLAVLVLPFLPLKWSFSLYWYNHPEEKRHKNIFYVLVSFLLVLVLVTLMQPVLSLVHWFGDLSFIRWVLSFIPTYAEYTGKVYEAVLVNLLFCIAVFWLFGMVKTVTGWVRPAKKKKEKPKKQKKEKKSLWTRIKEWWAKKKEERRKKKEERLRRRAEKKRLKKLAKERAAARRARILAGEDPDKIDEDPQDEKDTKKNDEPKPEPPAEPQVERDERDDLPENLLPEPEEDVFNGKIVLLGKTPEQPKQPSKAARKRGSSRKTAQPTEKEENIIAQFCRMVCELFYVKHEDGTWYVQPQCKKVAKHLRNFLILVGIAYILLFLLLLIPIFFKVEIQHWDIYDTLLRLMDNSYLYPAVALVVLTEVFWFMNGRLPEEPVEDIHVAAGKQRGRVVDLNAIEQQLIQTYGEAYEIKSFSSADVEVQRRAHITVDTSEDVILQKVLSFAQSEKLMRSDEYLRGIQSLQKGKSVVFDAPLYTAVSMYLFPYLNIRISQGERLLVVCHSADEVPAVIENMREGFRRVQHAHECIWTINSRKDLRTDNQTDILVVTPADFLDDRFFSEIREFSKRLTITLFPDADKVISTNNYLCVIMAQRLQEMLNPSDSHFVESQEKAMQYVFLSTRHMLNLARNLTEYFLLRESVVDISGDSAFGNMNLYVWRARGQGKVVLDNSSQTVQLETSIANIASKNGVPNVAMFTDGAIFTNQIDAAWLDTYDVYDRPIGFTVVSDDNYNLPSTIYTYSRYLCKEASVLHVISQPYMLRDYFYDDAVRSLFERPLMEHGMATHAKVNQMGMILLLCRLMKGMPVIDFAAKMAEYADVECSEKLTYPEIRQLVERCLKIAFGPEASVEQYGFTLDEKMDENLQPVTYVQVREEGLLNQLMADTQLVTVQMSTNGVRESKTLPLFKRMLAQRYLPGQHMVIDHVKYHINRIDYDNGVIYVSEATSTHNVPDQYVQIREYTLENPEEFIRNCRYFAAGNTTPLVDNISGDQRSTDGENELRTLTMVRASGALPMDSHTVAYYDCASNPGGVDLTGTLHTYNTDMHRRVDNALYLRFGGDFEGNDRLTMTLSILLQEMMKTMFPDQHFCVSVCPILRDPDSIYQHSDDFCRRIAKMYPKLHGWEKAEDNAIELLIIDDCEGGTGVLDMLYDGQAVYLSNILDMLCHYLDWLEEHPEGAYLNFGAKERPLLYDLVRLRTLLAPFYHPYLREQDLFSRLTPTNVCHFCEDDLSEQQSVLWQDRHNVCEVCDGEYRPTEEEAGWILDYIYTFLSRRFGVTLPAKLRVESSETVDISALDVEAQKILLHPDLPLTAVHMEILRQTVRLWQMENLRMTGDPEFEGQVLFVLLQYLEHLQQHSICKRLHGRALAQSDNRSVGYANLRQALMVRNHDNSFRYMLETFRKGASPVIKVDPKRSTRAQDPGQITHFFASQLSETDRAVYDVLVDGLANRVERIDVSAYGYTYEQIDVIWRSVRLDHPEFHWYNPYYYDRDYDAAGNVTHVIPNYWFDAAEGERRQQEVESVVDVYLEGITPEMSDFDVALQVYLNMAREIDYDSIALDRQKKQDGGRGYKRNTPDDLRNIHGALVQRKAVCAGYAVAYQYLLQQMGIEAMTVTGDAGGRHAWNIIKMEGDYYHVDVTWGDGSNTDPAKHRDEPSFAYFGLTDQEMLQARSMDPEPPAPPCRATGCNYFVRNGLFFTAYDHKTVKERLVAFLKDGTKKRVDLRFANDQILDVANRQLVYNGGLEEVLRATDRKGNFTSFTTPQMHIFTAFFEPSADDGKQ